MTEPVVLGLFLASGVVAGFAFQRSRLCFVGSLRDLFLFGDTGMTRAVLVLFGLTTLLGAVAAWWREAALPAGPGPGALAVGGALFGVGMVLAGSCASGAMWRLGEGQRSQFWILAGLLAGSWVYVAVYPDGLAQVQLQTSLTPWVSATVFGLGLGGLLLWERAQQAPGEELPPLQANSRSSLRLPWPPAVGAVVVAVALAGFVALTGQVWRLSSLFLLADASAALFGLGLLAGGHVGARFGHEWRPRGAGGFRPGALRLVGGMLMGFGARVGAGCTIGALLGGLVTSTAQVWIWLVAATAGAWIGSLLLRRFMNLYL